MDEFHRRELTGCATQQRNRRWNCTTVDRLLCTPPSMTIDDVIRRRWSNSIVERLLGMQPSGAIDDGIVPSSNVHQLKPSQAIDEGLLGGSGVHPLQPSKTLDGGIGPSSNVHRPQPRETVDEGLIPSSNVRRLRSSETIDGGLIPSSSVYWVQRPARHSTMELDRRPASTGCNPARRLVPSSSICCVRNPARQSTTVQFHRGLSRWVAYPVSARRWNSSIVDCRPGSMPWTCLFADWWVERCTLDESSVVEYLVRQFDDGYR